MRKDSRFQVQGPRENTGGRLVLPAPATGRSVPRSRGFTLVEMIVAIGLFAVVMLISVGALLALVGANKKAQALQSVMNNLNVSLDDMVRTIRTGSNYRCGSVTGGDCQNGDVALYITPFSGDPAKRTDDIEYLFGNGTNLCPANRLCKSVGGATPVPITSSDITINSFEFYVVGTARNGDTTQPKVVMFAKGTAAASGIQTKTSFNIQSTAVQRLLDL